MKHHTKILIWENDRRLNKLIKFHDLVIRYFNSKNVVDQTVRIKINQDKAEIRHIIISSGISTEIIYDPSLLFRGRLRVIDLIFDMFDLWELRIPHEKVVDTIETSIGIYESNRTKSIWRMFNPFFWLGRVADGISEVVFNVVGEFGLDRQNAEKSALGKLFKGLVYLITSVVAPISGLLQILGFLEPLKQFVHKMF